MINPKNLLSFYQHHNVLFFLQAGYGSVSWLVFAELLPPAIRATAYPLGIAVMWFMNFILTTLYEPMLAKIGTHGFLWFYAGLSSLGCIFIAVCIPETKGKMPFEIADFYREKHKVRQWMSRRVKKSLKSRGSKKVLKAEHAVIHEE